MDKLRDQHSIIITHMIITDPLHMIAYILIIAFFSTELSGGRGSYAQTDRVHIMIS